MTLRPIRAEDEELERELLENLSDQSLYFRFFSAGIKVTHQMLSRFTNIDYDREMAVVAEYTQSDGKHIAGVVRLALSSDRKEGEYAIAIRDDWHGRGIGGKMTDYILEIARIRNILRIHATVLSDNNPMIRLFESRGFRTWSIDEETIGVEKFM
jgi:acetyltransferase